MHLHLQCLSLEWTLLGYKQWIQQLAKCLPICSPDVYPFQRTIYKGGKGRINTFHSASENRAQSVKKSHLSLVELSSIIYMQWQELGQPFVGAGGGGGGGVVVWWEGLPPVMVWCLLCWEEGRTLSPS